MSRTLFNIQPLLPAIARGACILTPNSRLRNKLLTAWHQQQSSDRCSWQGPQVFSVEEWLSEHYQKLLDSAVQPEPCALITTFTAQQLWLNIIQNSPEGAELVNPLKLANDAHNAWQTLQRWQIDPLRLQSLCDERQWQYDSPFAQWAHSFHEALQQRQLCTREDVQAQLLQHWNSTGKAAADELILLGFDDVTPLQRALFGAAAATLTELPANDPKRQPQCVTVAPYASSEDELRAAALWCEQILLQDPDATIGVIAPNLGQIRSSAERIFSEVLEPHYALPETPRYTLPFNFSAGIPLGDTALINDAMGLLRLNHQEMETQQLQQLLSSPFWLAGEQLALSLPLLQRLQRHQRSSLRVGKLRQWVHKISVTEEADEPLLPALPQWQALDQALQDFESLRRQFGREHLPSVWLELFRQQLHLLGWPGQRRPDSNEYQQMSQWLQLLDSYCQLDALQQPVSCSRALELLNQLVGQTHYQAQTPETPIQVLGILEGAGLNFSHVWMLGLSQNQWPPAPTPNPLLPLPLQRHYHMPHADADRELHYARAILDNYQHGTGQWVISYARFDEDRPQHPSPLLQPLHTGGTPRPALPDADALLSSGWQAFQQTLATRQRLQWLNIGSAPAVSEAEKQLIRGGSQIFRNQALLPQAAFLIHRLQAEAPALLARGFSPIDRGQILHDALSQLWRQWRTRAALAALDESQRRQQINDVLEPIIRRYQQREPEIFGDQYCLLERQRQLQLIERWLQQELERPDFTVVANEELLEVEFAGLSLRLRLDRMDQLSNGELLVIDYKTGNPKPRQWGGERPEEPQLPLYCLCYSADIAAIVFVQINANEIAIMGLGELSQPHAGIYPPAQTDKLGLPAEWDAVREHWRTHLTALAQEFLQGETPPDLSHAQAARYYEHLLPILRWNEQEEIVAGYRRQQPAGAEGNKS